MIPLIVMGYGLEIPGIERYTNASRPLKNELLLQTFAMIS